ncbi:hypothetical protein HDE68_003832 [Pedobacter cryoconitis]|uniref:Uncharacterized protein n=1 Tax=Pedobacter cryoconitis TaxID=188932 RepID=A0A7W8ZQ69_9SPHI|nr:hypothetical protein [Pedobacter cryoconitis]
MSFQIANILAVFVNIWFGPHQEYDKINATEIKHIEL